MKSKVKIIVLLTALAIGSCVDTDNKECYYEDCFSQYPTIGSLTVKVTQNSMNSSVPIQIYSGHYDDGELIREDTLYDDRQNYVLPPGVYYSVVAKYKTKNGEIVVVDGDKIEVESRKECDSTCYSVNEAKVNCKLHY